MFTAGIYYVPQDRPRKHSAILRQADHLGLHPFGPLLRGDVGKEAIDIYLHNDMEKIRKEYLACIPKLGI